VLEIRLLGPLEVRDDERDMTPRRQKQRALLAVLALKAGSAVSADRLVDDLWAERAPKTARHALENYVSELRRTLGKDLIETRPSGYLLRLAPECVDVVRFERLVADARREQRPEEREARFGTALSLLRGEPLADLAFEPFAGAEIARLQELELGAREELLDARLELGHHAEIVGELERLVNSHPYRERFRAQLMVALYRAGRQADALAAYQAARHDLLEELGIDPGEELQHLERAILRQDPALRAPPRAPRAAPEMGPANAPVRPARKTVTIIHAELTNSAALAERLDAELLRAVLDRYLEISRAAVERHGGVCATLADGVTQAIFGLPSAHEDDALRGVRAAVELREGIGVVNDGLLLELGVFLEVQIGVSTGEVLVTPERQQLATGRAVTAARELERMALPGRILLGAATYELIGDAVEVEPADDTARAFRLVELLADTYGRPLRLDAALVGRRRALSALASSFEDAVADRALHLFTVLGTAGVGKSRLVREFVESIDGVATVLHGRCLPYGDGITYRPLTEALGEAALVLPDLENGLAEAVRHLLERLALERPLVLVLDDLHFAEPDLLGVVEHLARSSRTASILVVCVARPELLDSSPGWGGGNPNATTTLLEPLSEAETERLLDNLLGESDLPDAVRDYVLRTADGNPLFVEELLAMLVDRDILTRREGRWTTTELPAIPVPATIRALIEARIDRLAERERRALELASVVGKRFERADVAELAGSELAADLDLELTALVRKELIRPHAAEPHRFSFRHQLIRDAAYASLPMQARAELHERLADIVDRPSSSTIERGELSAYHRDWARRYRDALGRGDPQPSPSTA
jgi:DNA-binding SARP family transcriptional activator